MMFPVVVRRRFIFEVGLKYDKLSKLLSFVPVTWF